MMVGCSNCYVLFLFILLFECNFALNHKGVPCSSVPSSLPSDRCKCVFPDGQGLDLTPLSSEHFQWVSSINNKNHSILFAPCVGEMKNTSECYRYSVCLSVNSTNTNRTEYFNLGNVADGVINFKTINDLPQLEFTLHNTSTIIHLKCDETAAPTKLEFLTDNDNHFELELQSPHSCLKDDIQFGHEGPYASALTTLTIIIIILFLVYFGGGMLVLKFIKGAQGIEMIPNHQFWLHLPTHLKRGVLFLANGCQNPVSYDTI